MVNDRKLSPGNIVRRCLWVLLYVGELALILFLSYLSFSDFAAVVHLQPARCTITSVQITTTPYDSPDAAGAGETDTPVIALTLHTPQGQNYQTIADTPSFSSPDGAQAYVARYQVKQTYPCWYNPHRPTLVRLSQELITKDYVSLVVAIFLPVSVVLLWVFLFSIVRKYTGVPRLLTRKT